jgi:hypothetical protein
MDEPVFPLSVDVEVPLEIIMDALDAAVNETSAEHKDEICVKEVFDEDIFDIPVGPAMMQDVRVSFDDVFSCCPSPKRGRGTSSCSTTAKRQKRQQPVTQTEGQINHAWTEEDNLLIRRAIRALQVQNPQKRIRYRQIVDFHAVTPPHWMQESRHV